MSEYFQKTLHELKFHSKMSTKQISAVTGIAESTITRYLTHEEALPTFENVCRLADCFGVPVDYFTPNRNRYVVKVDEYEIIHNYRTLTPPLQDKIRTILQEEQNKLYSDGYNSNAAKTIRQFREIADLLRTPQINEAIKYLKEKYDIE